jgi:hypothetical protein
MGFSLTAGLVYTLVAGTGSGASLALGGLIAGAVCALIGIGVSYALKDVPASLLLLGTVSSAVTGAIGGFVGKFLTHGSAIVGVAVLAAGSTWQAAAQATSSQATARQLPTRGGASGAHLTTQDFSWLAGRWEGHVSNAPGLADVTFAPPAGGTIPAVMRLVDGDKVLVVELISMLDTPDGVELRYRHFSASLEAYESTYKQAMRLASA